MKIKSIAIAIITLAALVCQGAESTVTEGPRKLQFAWGAELSGNVDMSQHNMSGVGIGAAFGLSWKWMRFLGVGAQGDFMVSNSSRVYPVYLNFRTDFSNTNKLLFLDLRGGYALSYFNDLEQSNCAYFSGGIGATLARGKSFSSHLIVGYTYLGQKECYNGTTLRKCPGISMVSMRLGVTFGSSSKNQTRVSGTDDKSQLSLYQKPSEGFPAFVKINENVIILPERADRQRWQNVAQNILDAKKEKQTVDLLIIGDSHIQAEMGTSEMRRKLQGELGNGGRGLISAYKLAGTNQPVDYQITAAYAVDSQVRLLKRPWPIKPGFTGVASSSCLSNKITFKNSGQGHKFNNAKIFTSKGCRNLTYASPVDSVSFYIFPNEKLYGMYTCDTTQPGIVLSTIGNNGACYSDYLLLDDFAQNVSTLNPQLIILAMGTNEGFSSMTDEEIYNTSAQLIDNLKEANPEAQFIIWTPMECHKKDNNEIFEINTRVRDARDILLNLARDKGIAYWDFYEVAGGYGIAQKWVDADLMNPKDHVHLLGKGYRIQGELAAEALIEFLKSVRK